MSKFVCKSQKRTPKKMRLNTPFCIKLQLVTIKATELVLHPCCDKRQPICGVVVGPVRGLRLVRRKGPEHHEHSLCAPATHSACYLIIDPVACECENPWFFMWGCLLHQSANAPSSPSSTRRSRPHYYYYYCVGRRGFDTHNRKSRRSKASASSSACHIA